MRRNLLGLIVLVSIIIGLLIFRRRRKVPPSSLSGGINYMIPWSCANTFSITLPRRTEKVTLDDLLNNRVVHPNIDYTEVFFDGDLRANSSIGYIAPDNYPNAKNIIINLTGNLDPNMVTATMCPLSPLQPKRMSKK